MLKPNLFISYKRGHDQTLDAIRQIEAALSAAGFTVWRDTSIRAGAMWSSELYGWLIECSAAIALIGKEAANSEWCRREWWFLRERQRANNLPLVPICLDGSNDSAGIFDDFQIVDLTAFLQGDVILRLISDGAVRPSAKNYLSAHHAWLRWLFYDAPVLGRERFSLADIYVETDCGCLLWADLASEGPTIDPFNEDAASGGRQ